MSHKSHKRHKGCCQHQEEQRGHHRRDVCRQRHGRSGQHHDQCCSQERSCGCEGGHHIKRRFLTKEEKIARLEAYLRDIQTEAQAVQEHIASLKAE